MLCEDDARRRESAAMDVATSTGNNKGSAAFSAQAKLKANACASCGGRAPRRPEPAGYGGNTQVT